MKSFMLFKISTLRVILFQGLLKDMLNSHKGQKKMWTTEVSPNQEDEFKFKGSNQKKSSKVTKEISKRNKGVSVQSLKALTFESLYKN